MKLNTKQRDVLLKAILVSMHDNNVDGFTKEEIAELDLLKAEIGKYRKNTQTD